MLFEFIDKHITGVLSVLPENESIFEEETKNPNDSKNQRLKNIIGFGNRRRVKGNTTLSDMLLYGMHYLLDVGYIKREEIGAIVVSTLSQDYFLPQISMILHGELNLSKDVFCIDTPQACAGFTMGLIESFMLLEHMADNKKVILCTGEIFNRKSDEGEPKFEHPSFGGDVANITVIENKSHKNKIYASVYNDGMNRDVLMIKYGGFKYPMTSEQLAVQTNNIPTLGVEMDGTAVFNFVQQELPPALKELIEFAGIKEDMVDWFLFHQPNKFMLQKLANKIGVPYSKVPMDITEKLGNSDSGTIPVVMTTDISEDLLNKNNLCCLSGFGGGLTWASIIMNVGMLDFCENMLSNL